MFLEHLLVAPTEYHRTKDEEDGFFPIVFVQSIHFVLPTEFTCTTWFIKVFFIDIRRYVYLIKRSCLLWSGV